MGETRSGQGDARLSSPVLYPITPIFFYSIVSSIFVLFFRFFFSITTRSTTAAREVQSRRVWRGSQVLTAVSLFRQDHLGTAAAEQIFDRPTLFFGCEIAASYNLCYRSSRILFFSESMIPPGGGGFRRASSDCCLVWCCCIYSRGGQVTILTKISDLLGFPEISTKPMSRTWMIKTSTG